MIRLGQRVHYSMLSLLFLALFAVNFALQNPVLGLALAVFFALFYGYRLGHTLFPTYPQSARAVFGSVSLLTVLFLIASACYYLYALPTTLWFVLVIATPIALAFLPAPEPFAISIPSILPRLLPAISISLFLVTVWVLLQTNITDAVRSPWERIDSSVFWLFGLGVFSLIPSFFQKHGESVKLVAMILGCFTAVAVAAIVYPLGFGFDTFLHQATLSHISQFGTITPKPFYYIGEYTSVLLLADGFQLGLSHVERWILPILAAVTIPFTTFFVSRSIQLKESLAATLALFLLPLSTFIVTTPQGMANLWTLLLILWSLPFLLRKEGSIVPLALLAVGAAVIHPLAGIPALIYLALLIAVRPPSWIPSSLSRPVFWLLVVLGSVVVPLIFVVNGLVSGLDLTLEFGGLAPANVIQQFDLPLIFESGFSFLLDLTYLWQANALLIVVIVAAWMLIRFTKSQPLIWLPAIMALILGVNYIVMQSVVEVTFLIDYERGNYAGRLVTLIWFFLFPYLMIAFSSLFSRLRTSGGVSQVFSAIMIAGLVVSQLYLFYPRRDNYETSRGFNMGQADLIATRHIHNTAPDDYVVLANQQVSAAAVLQYGFQTYYDDVFYYPIPTGGALYQQFLEMNETPSYAHMEAAMDLAGVSTAYYVVNNYWWQAPKLIETAKTQTDDWIAIDGGRVHIFRYDRL